MYFEMQSAIKGMIYFLGGVVNCSVEIGVLVWK